MKIFTERGFERELYRRTEAIEKERWEDERRRVVYDRISSLENAVNRLTVTLEKKEVITEEEATAIRSGLAPVLHEVNCKLYGKTAD